MKLCKFCNVELKENVLNQNYLTCSICKFSIKFKNIVMQDINDYIKLYDNDEKIVRELIGDSMHYSRFKNNLPKENYDKIVAFGGGFPKLESYLNSNKIIVYDFIKDIYEKRLNIFRNYFSVSVNKDIEYYKNIITHNNIANIIYKELENVNNILLTFVHIFEHYKYDDFEKIIKVLGQLNSKDKTIYVLIYQPNIENAHNNKWFHFAASEHLTFVPLNKYIELLKNNNFEIIKSMNYNDDLFIYSKLNKNGGKNFE